MFSIYIYIYTKNLSFSEITPLQFPPTPTPPTPTHPTNPPIARKPKTVPPMRGACQTLARPRLKNICDGFFPWKAWGKKTWQRQRFSATKCSGHARGTNWNRSFAKVLSIGLNGALKNPIIGRPEPYCFFFLVAFENHCFADELAENWAEFRLGFGFCWWFFHGLYHDESLSFTTIWESIFFTFFQASTMQIQVNLPQTFKTIKLKSISENLKKTSMYRGHSQLFSPSMFSLYVYT